MQHGSWRRFLLVAGALLLATALAPSADRPPATGPRTEKRFPPLRLPPGFRATLFACDPLVAYPSAIAPGPRPGSLFVAVDYLTGLGTSLERRDEIRLIEDTDGDGYADRATVFASGLNSIQGLAYHDGTLFVMHAPYLTALRDTRGAGKADRRQDLLTGLGLAPETDQIRLHNANGVVVGHDGWLYLALGDRGSNVARPEGDRLVLHGGGILRCRPDGRDLHVFASGLRNVYDVALDEDLNVFFRDNENDGGTYKIRVCHSFFGADHGYPYLYDEHPDEALPPLADLGLGSSAGAVCYLETQFPAAYRGGLLFCEWGRAVVHYPLRRASASFAPARETDFAAGAPADPYGFKPTDLVVGPDGSLFIADWADGQRPHRGRGRIYQVRYTGTEGTKPTASAARPLPERLDQQIARLDSPSHLERCQAQEAIARRGKDGATAVAAALDKHRLGVRGRLHAIWVMARVEGTGAVAKLLAVAKSDQEPRVQAQAVRAIADLADPVLVRHRLDAGAGDAALAEKLASLPSGRDPRVQLEVLIALGRLRWPGLPAWLRKHLKEPDAALAHAAQGGLRRVGNWPAVLKLLDEPSGVPLRAIARRAATGQFDKGLVDGLIERLARETDAARRLEYAGLLARVYKKPGAWTYWGFRPVPRRANTVTWDRSEAIGRALGQTLATSDRAGRLAIFQRMQREAIPIGAKVIGPWLAEERDPAAVAALLGALRGRPGAEAQPRLEAMVRDRRQTTSNRLLAASLIGEGPRGGDRLAVVAAAVEDGPVLAELLRGIGAKKGSTGAKLVLAKLASPNAEVRAAAVGAAAALRVPDANAPVQKLLGDADSRVRAAAARAAGNLSLRTAASRLLELARDSDAEVRRSSLESLRRLREPGALAVALAALNDPATDVAALECIGELGGPANAAAVAELVRRRPSANVLAAAGRVLMGWASRDGLASEGRRQIERSLAQVHGGSGVLLGWHVRGPLPGDGADLVAALRAGRSLPTDRAPAPGWRLVPSAGVAARVRLGPARGNGAWLAYSELVVAEEAKVDFFTTSSAPMTVWLDGTIVYRRDRPGVPGPYPDRFDTTLTKGPHRLLVRLEGVKGAGAFQLRFRRKSASAVQERLARAALSRAGNPAAGRRIFLNAEKSLCIKCHRIDGQGERVGPELTGLGSRFSKAYVVESILEPSRTVSPSFASTLVQLKNGKILTGIQVAETAASITLVDSEGKQHALARSDIEERKSQPGSTMPDGLEKRLTEDEFVDLVSFLMSLKETRPR